MYPSPRFYTVARVDDDGAEQSAHPTDDALDLEEAVALARKTDRAVVYAHGRYPGARRFVRWTVRS